MADTICAEQTSSGSIEVEGTVANAEALLAIANEFPQRKRKISAK
jgi:hypothetical protein